MSASSSKAPATIGFLTVLDQGEPGLVGGYLVLNSAGRPLEFHCTAPVRANRAQEILYGPTLKPFLYGEQIGQTLLNKSALEPLLVCTDMEPVLAVREFSRAPVCWVKRDDDESGTGNSRSEMVRIESGHRGVTQPHLSFTIGKYRARVTRSQAAEQAVIEELWPQFADHIDLLEPFGRIREAIEETQRPKG